MHNLSKIIEYKPFFRNVYIFKTGEVGYLLFPHLMELYIYTFIVIKWNKHFQMIVL